MQLAGRRQAVSPHLQNLAAKAARVPIVGPVLVRMAEYIGAGLVPVGTIVLWPGVDVPAGWMACDGGILSVAQNRACFAVLGFRFGGNDQSFALPDFDPPFADDDDETTRYIIKVN
jgi:hypothetical protein